MSQRNWFFAFLTTLVALAALYYWISTPHTKDIVLIGTVDANQVVVSSKVTGRIEKLTVEEGQSVKAGDLIATVDSEQYQAQRKSAEAQLASLRSEVDSNDAVADSTSGDTLNQVALSRANLRSAQASLQEDEANLKLQETVAKRIISLAQDGVASQQERDQAESALAAQKAHVQGDREKIAAAESALQQSLARTQQARAAERTAAATRGQMRSAQAQLAEAVTQLGYTRIYAPVSAKVNLCVAREGEIVNPGSPIVVLMDLAQTWVYVPLPETYVDGIQLGEQFTVRMPSGATLPGKVIAKSSEADFATQRDVSRVKRDIKTVQLKLLIDNPDMDYVPGMTAEILVSPDQSKRTPGLAEVKIQ
jgi:HlyD family secretion protein